MSEGKSTPLTAGQYAQILQVLRRARRAAEEEIAREKAAGTYVPVRIILVSEDGVPGYRVIEERG